MKKFLSRVEREKAGREKKKRKERIAGVKFVLFLLFTKQMKIFFQKKN